LGSFISYKENKELSPNPVKLSMAELNVRADQS
jgi:hypothetical protein